MQGAGVVSKELVGSFYLVQVVEVWNLQVLHNFIVAWLLGNCVPWGDSLAYIKARIISDFGYKQDEVSDEMAKLG